MTACSSCGAVADPGAAFCGDCGHVLIATAEGQEERDAQRNPASGGPNAPLTPSPNPEGESLKVKKVPFRRKVLFVIVALLLLAGIAGVTTSRSTDRPSFTSALAAMGAAQKSVATDAIAGSSSGDYNAMSGACNQLRTDVTALQATAIPKSYTSVMRRELANIETDNKDGADSCILAVNSNSQSRLNSAIRFFSAATTHEDQLTRHDANSQGSESSSGPNTSPQPSSSASGNGNSQHSASGFPTQDPPSSTGSTSDTPITTGIPTRPITTTTTTSPPATTTTTSPPTTTTTTTPLPPDQAAFVADATNQIAPVSASINQGVLTNQQLGSDGEDACVMISTAINEGNNGQNAYEASSQNLKAVFSNLNLSDGDANTFLSLAIENICSTFLSDIPPGDPGSP
jgi:hypothetical protein